MLDLHELDFLKFYTIRILMIDEILFKKETIVIISMLLIIMKLGY